MLVLNILSGPQAGQSFPLDKPQLIIGRSLQADIVIESSQVSKKHAQLNIKNQGVYLTDLNSRNGTFVNGVQVHQQIIKESDKITLHDVVITITKQAMTVAPSSVDFAAPQSLGHLAVDSQALNYSEPIHDEPKENLINPMSASADYKDKLNNYLDEVVLPGVYKLAEWFDFKWVLAGLLGSIIFLITVLSTFPAINLLKSSIEKESQRRALTIAKNLAEINKSTLAQGLHSSLQLNSAANEAGVLQALIINANGSVIAPSSKAGEHLDIPFIHTARQEGKTQVQQISHNEIGAIVPMSFYNANTGNHSVAAYSFILYDMGSLAIDDGRTISLYIQVLFIALIVGSLLMFFVFKLFEYPFVNINAQLNEELKNPTGNIKLNYNLESAQKLISNINSSLSRSPNDSMSLSSTSEYDRTYEINNVIQMIGFPALAITNPHQAIAAINASAAESIGLGPDNLGLTLEQLNDQALKLSLKDLLDQSSLNPGQMNQNELEISGANYEIMMSSIYGKNDISYFIVSFIPKEDQE